MLENPIVKKELLTVLRSRGAVVLALVFVASLSLLGFMMWPRAGLNPLGALHSRVFFTVVTVGQLLLLGLFIPPFAATTISHEREINTYDMLYFTPLGPLAILFGKAAGAVGFLLVLVLLSMPVTAVCFLLGGVRPGDLAWVYLIIITAGVVFALIGMMFSSLFQKSFGAIVATYVTFLVLCGGVHMPMLLLPKWTMRSGALIWGYPIIIGIAVAHVLLRLMSSSEFQRSLGTIVAAYVAVLVLFSGVHGTVLLFSEYNVIHLLRCTSPFTAIVAKTRDCFRDMGAGASQAALRYFFTVSGVLALWALAVSFAKVARMPATRPMKRQRVVDKTTGLGVRVLRRAFFLIDPRRRRRVIGSVINPVMILDLRTHAAGLSNVIRASAFCFIFGLVLVLLVCGTFGDASVDRIRLIAIGFQLGLIGLIGPSLTVGAISSDVESRRFDALRMTLLRPWTFLLGKIEAAMVFSLMLVLAAVPIFFAILWIEERFRIHYLVVMLSVSLALIVATASAGLFFSSICRRTAHAAAWTYGLVALLFVGSLVGLVLGDRLSPGLATAVVGLNPVVTVVSQVSTSMFVADKFLKTGLLWQTNLWWLCGLSVVFMAGTTYRLHRLFGATE